MKNDLISRQALCEYALNQKNKNITANDIMRFPSAQPESKKGKWIEAYDPFNRISGRCSACGWEAHLYEDDVVGMNFCPNCGLRMEGEIK